MIDNESLESANTENNTPIIGELLDLRGDISDQKILSRKEYQDALQKPALSLEKEVFNHVMLRRINELRRQEKLSPISYDKNIENLAQSFGEELASNNERWNCSNPHKDKNGNFIKGRIRRMGLDNYIDLNEDIGENIIEVGNNSIEKILSRVMNSPGHKKALMSNTNIASFSYTDPVVQVFANKKK